MNPIRSTAASSRVAVPPWSFSPRRFWGEHHSQWIAASPGAPHAWTYPRPRHFPRSPRARQPRRCWGSGIRTGPALLLSHQFQVWGVAVFPRLTRGPEGQRGGEGHRGGQGPGPSGQRIGAAARLPPGAGESRDPAASPPPLLFMRSWKLLGRAVFVPAR